MFQYLKQGTLKLKEETYGQALKNIKQLGADTFKAIEQFEKNLDQKSKQAGVEFDQFTVINSESSILRNKFTSASQKIDLIIQQIDKKKDDLSLPNQEQHFNIEIDDDDNLFEKFEIENQLESTQNQQQTAVGKFRRMLDCERDFLIDYTMTPIHKIVKKQSQMDDYVKDIIYIVNHIFEYGFSPKQFKANEKSFKITHYWDLLSKYMQEEHTSILFINQIMNEGINTSNTECSNSQEGSNLNEDWVYQSKTEKALTWILLSLSEDQLLYYCFFQILKQGSILTYYDEDESFFFKYPQQILQLTKQIYANNIQIESDVKEQYKGWLADWVEQKRLKEKQIFMYRQQKINEMKGNLIPILQSDQQQDIILNEKE